MIFGFNGNTRMKTLAGALVVAMASVASAAYAGTTLVGGGATLPAIGYGGDASHRLIAPASNSFLGVFSAQTGNPVTSYCQTGSGAGKNILAGVSGTSVQNTCGPDFPSTVTVTGFSAGDPSIGRSDLTQPNFVGADSPLSIGDYNNYLANRSSSKPVQFPAVAGAVAIAFNKAGVDTLNVTDAALCKVFAGTITTWQALALESGVTGIPGSVTGPINVVFRSDGSGTTFGFSNHLSAVCAGTASLHLVTDQAFSKVVSLYYPATNSTNQIPSNWIGQSGNPAVVNKILNTDGAIGYAEAANVSGALGLFATVNGRDPQADFGSSKVVINSTDVVYNQAINGANTTTGRPALADVSSPLPSTSCIALVKPDSYATQPSTSYPIVAVSYLLGNSNNNGATDAANVRKLLNAPYNSAITGSAALTTIGPGTGLSFLNASFSQIDSCIVN